MHIEARRHVFTDERGIPLKNILNGVSRAKKFEARANGDPGPLQRPVCRYKWLDR